MKLTKQIEEARTLLDSAIAAMDEQDVKIQSLPEDPSPEEVAFHEEVFKSRKADVTRLRGTLERLIDIEEARKSVPSATVEDDAVTDKKRDLIKVGREPLVYEMDSPHSYFRDLVYSKLQGDEAASERLFRHGRQVVVEGKAGSARQTIEDAPGKFADVTTADPGVASFIPPLYMGGLWIDTAIAGRPFADAVPKIPLSPVGKRMDFPRVATAPDTGVQAAEADAVHETDFDAETYSVSKVTIAGQNDLSIQALEFSDPSMDVVIMRELIRDYNSKLDYQLIYGSGSSGQHRGIKTVVVSDSGNTVAFSSGGGDDLLGKLYDALSQIATNQPGFEASHVLLHSRRAAWMASHRDANGNLFQQGQLFLAAGPQAGGFVGNAAGLNVIRDANILTTQGTGTNEDDVYVLDISQLLLAEGAVRTRVLSEVLSGTLQVRVQLYAFSAFAGGRRPKVITRISGAGLAAPTFPST